MKKLISILLFSPFLGFCQSKITVKSGSGTFEPVITSPNTTLKYWTGYKTWGMFNDSVRSAITLTTTGISGAATYSGGVLNIPQYTGGSSPWTTTGSNIYYNTGKVFIGATSDDGSGSKLQVTGSINASSNISGYSIIAAGSYYLNNGASLISNANGNQKMMNLSDDWIVYNSPDGSSSVETARFKGNNTVLLNSLKTGSTAPTTSGTTKMVVSDANGSLSFATIPSGGTTNLALGTATSSTQPITNSNGTGFTLPTFSTTAGLVPGTTSNTSTFLRADGTWATPAPTGAETEFRPVLALYAPTNSGTHTVLINNNHGIRLSGVSGNTGGLRFYSPLDSTYDLLIDYKFTFFDFRHNKTGQITVSTYDLSSTLVSFSKTFPEAIRLRTGYDAANGNKFFIEFGDSTTNWSDAQVNMEYEIAKQTDQTRTNWYTTSQQVELNPVYVGTKIIDTVLVYSQSSGTYTPTWTNSTNVTSSTAYQCQYTRVGSVVTVSGRVQVSPTATSAATLLTMSLPITSAFTASENAGGTGFSRSVGGPSAGTTGSFYANASASTVSLEFYNTSGTTQVFTFSYMYLIQ